MKTFSTLLSGFLFFAALSTSATVASALDYSWIGGSGSWTSNANWSVGGSPATRPPDSRDRLVGNASGATIQLGGAAARALESLSPSANLSILPTGATGTLSVTDSITVSSGVTLSLRDNNGSPYSIQVSTARATIAGLLDLGIDGSLARSFGSFASGTTLLSGTIRATTNGAADSNVTHSVDLGHLTMNGGTLIIAALGTGTGSHPVKVASLSGSGAITSGTGRLGVLVINGDETGERTFSGTINNGAGASGSISVQMKASEGVTQILSGINSYSGGTLLQGGTLVASNSQALGASGGNVVLSGPGKASLRLESGVLIGNDILFSNTHVDSKIERVIGVGGAINIGTSGILSSHLTDGTDTQAMLLAGTNTGETTITLSMSFHRVAVASNDTDRRSDVFRLTGDQGSVYVLQLSLNTETEEPIQLGWLNQGEWQLAIGGNTGSGSLAGDQGNISFNTFIAYHGGSFDAETMLGAYGYDTGNGSVWAVINHNSEFSIVSIPEPNVAWMVGLIVILMATSQAKFGKHS